METKQSASREENAKEKKMDKPGMGKSKIAFLAVYALTLTLIILVILENWRS